MSQTISHNGLALVKDAEGFRSKAYQDSVGIWTIGFGTIRVNGVAVKQGDVCTEQEAETWLAADMQATIDAVNTMVKVPLTQNQFDALCSLGYNIGVGALRASTLVRLLNSGDVAGASGQFLRWDKAGGRVVRGLTSRRIRERSLFDT